MTLSHHPTGFTAQISDRIVTVITVEEPSIMAEYVQDLKRLLENDEGDFSLFEGEKELKLSETAEVILDPWSLDYNSKRIKGKLLRLVNDVAVDQFYEDFLNVRGSICSFVENVLEHIPYSIEYNMEPDINAISKMLDIRIEQGENTIVERLVEYMKLLSSLCSVKVFFFINLRSFISDEAMKLVYQEATYSGIALVLVESVQRSILENEQDFIIDRDKCIIQI